MESHRKNLTAGYKIRSGPIIRFTKEYGAATVTIGVSEIEPRARYTCVSAYITGGYDK